MYTILCNISLHLIAYYVAAYNSSRIYWACVFPCNETGGGEIWASICRVQIEVRDPQFRLGVCYTFVCQFWQAKANSSSCSLEKWAVTVVCLCLESKLFSFARHNWLDMVVSLTASSTIIPVFSSILDNFVTDVILYHIYTFSTMHINKQEKNLGENRKCQTTPSFWVRAVM